MHNISYYLTAMIPYMLSAAILAVPVRIAYTHRLRRKKLKSNIYHETGLIIYISFIAGLFSQTILTNIHTFRFGQVRSFINLIPGKIIYDSITLWQHGDKRYFVISLLGNIIMFMPFGFFTPLLWNNKSLRDSLLAGFLASLTVEICQLPQLNRTTDIDDLWLNTFGAFLGWMCYKLMLKLFPKFAAKFRIEKFYANKKSRLFPS